MSDIFVSYSSVDKERARIFVQAFERQGWSVWWSDNLWIGDPFPKGIKAELDSASCVVVLWSQHSVDSNPVINEALEAQGRGVLFPVLIERIKPPFLFETEQAAKLFDWQGDEADPEFHKLLKALARRLERTVPPPPPPPPKPGPRERRKLMPLYLGALVVLLALLVLSALWWSRKSTPGDKDLGSMKVKIDAQNVRLINVLRSCAQQVGARAATGSNLNINQPISITINDASLNATMNELCEMYDCTWRLVPGPPPLLFVDSKSRPSPQKADSAPAPPTP